MPTSRSGLLQRTDLSAGGSGWRRDPLKTLANTPGALLATVIGTWIGFGLAFAALEPEVSWFDGLYWSSVVKSTLGFGDVLPTNAASKTLTMVYVTWAIYFLLPAAIFHVGERILQSRDAFDHEEQEELIADAEEARQNTVHLREEVARLHSDVDVLLRELQALRASRSSEQPAQPSSSTSPNA